MYGIDFLSRCIHPKTDPPSPPPSPHHTSHTSAAHAVDNSYSSLSRRKSTFDMNHHSPKLRVAGAQAHTANLAPKSVDECAEMQVLAGVQDAAEPSYPPPPPPQPARSSTRKRCVLTPNITTLNP